MDWSKSFVRPILKAAGENPTALLEILAIRAEMNPALIPLFADAIDDLSEFYASTAEGLRAVSELKKLAQTNGARNGA